MRKTASFSTLALVGAGMALTSQSALAQDETPERRSTIDELDSVIVVTATKGQNPEDVQDVPLAVTAFNSDSLEALKVRDIQSLSYSSPNVSLDQVGTTRGTANFSIRGLGINSSIPSIDPTVGVFVDGVYLGYNGGVVFDLFDLDSVEIVRGPQGVLFGRNVTGGAVLINTGNPTEEFTGKFRASIDGPWLDSGRGGPNYTASAVVSGPIVADTILFKLGGYYNRDKGYFTNLANNSNHGEAETYILRGALEARLGGLTVVGKLDYFDSNGDGPSGQNHGTYSRDTFDFAIDNEGAYDSRAWTGSVRADLDLGPGTLTNIFGYRDTRGFTNGDIDSLPSGTLVINAAGGKFPFFFHSTTDTNQDQISNELRYAVDMDRFNLTVGGFYFDQSIAYTERRQLPPASPAQFYGGGAQDHEVLGLFAAGQFYLTDAFSLIGGIRWSEETKDADVTYIRPRPACSFQEGTCPQTGTNPFVPGEANGFSDSHKWSNWSPKFGAQYEFGPGQIYGHWTRGYRSGGYNFRITDPGVFLNSIVPRTGTFYFDEEKVDNYEIGGKFQTLDNSLTVNLAAYVTKVKNMQREINQPGPAGVSQYIVNTADATIKGFEAEARMRLSERLIVTANVGLIDDKYDKILFDISGSTGVNGIVNEEDFALRLPRVPEKTWGVGFIHEIPLGSGAIVSRANFQYRDEFAYTDNNFGWIPSAEQLDANISWESDMGLTLSLYGKNLLDDVQFGGDTQVPFGGTNFPLPGPLSDGNNRPFDPRPAAGTFSPLSKGRQVGVEAMFEF